MNDPKHTPPTNDESGLPTTPNAQSRAAYFEDMLPGVIASDERDSRLAQALKRRRSGVPLNIEELRRDLKAVLSQLTVSFMQYEQGFSTFLRTPTHVLDYAERVAAYAIKDYPRDFEADEDIAGQWDALNSIHVIGYAWRKGEDKTDGKILVTIVDQIASDAMMGVYPKHKAAETDKVSRVSDQDGEGTGSADKPVAKIYNETTRMDRIFGQATSEVSKVEAAVEQIDTDVGSTANAAELPNSEIDHTAPDIDTTAPESINIVEQTDTDVGSTANQTGGEVSKTDNAAEETISESGNSDSEAAKTDDAGDQTSSESDKLDSAATKSDEAGDQTGSKVDKPDTDDTIDFSW